MKQALLLSTLFFLLLTFGLNAFEFDKVEDFSFNDLEDKPHQFSEYKGKWVLVNYWATYCPPCLAEMPDIERFYQHNKDKFVALGFDVGGSEKADIAEFSYRNKINYPLIPSQANTMLAFGIIMAVPTSYVISPEGEIVDKFVGLITYDDLDFYVNQKKKQQDSQD